MSTASPSGPGGRDIDAAFEDIIARWDDDPVEPDRPLRPAKSVEATNPAPAGPMPADADLPPGSTRQPSGTALPPVPAPSAGQEHFGFRSYTPPEVEDTYTPPAPAPLPAPEADPTFWVIVGCLVVGPAIIILLVLTGRTSMTLLLGAAGLATAVGFVLLVLRGGREPRDPYDDGARL